MIEDIEIHDPHDIQYYDHIAEELEHKFTHKAQKFVDLGLIKKIEDFHYQCHPIKGYNTRIYDLRFNEGTGWKCNCQGWNKRHKDTGRGFCSHVQALMICFKRLNAGWKIKLGGRR